MKRITIDTFAGLAMKEFGTLDIRRKQMYLLRDLYDVCVPSSVKKNKVAAGLFRILGDPEAGDKLMKVGAPTVVEPISTGPVCASGTALTAESFGGIPVYSAPAGHSLVPEKNREFVAWGDYGLLKKLLKDSRFISIYVTGETGNGKTFNFEQVCAELGRELVEVNFTATTDSDDLIGGFRLINGDTVWVDGPVIEAMKRGAVLLLDEIDNGTEHTMELQSVLQGKPYFIKKLSRLVKPAEGFAVVATANTKGDGDGDYAFTNVLNKAFLDRFKILLEQPYPPPAVEKKILTKFAAFNYPDIPEKFIDNAVKMVSDIRSTYEAGGIAESISTRRLVDFTEMYGRLGDAEAALKLVTNRFDSDTQSAICDFWKTIAGEENSDDVCEIPATTDADGNPSIPF